MSWPIKFTIRGQAASKSNRRRLVLMGGKIRPIKSVEALAFERAAQLQIPKAARIGFAGEVALTLTMYYANQQSDLDESVVLDALQDQFARVGGKRIVTAIGVIRNDRQVREKHVYHFIDKANPRVEVEIAPRGTMPGAAPALL